MRVASILVLLAIATYAQTLSVADGKAAVRYIAVSCIQNSGKVPAAAQPLAIAAVDAGLAALGRRLAKIPKSDSGPRMLKGRSRRGGKRILRGRSRRGGLRRLRRRGRRGGLRRLISVKGLACQAAVGVICANPQAALACPCFKPQMIAKCMEIL